MGHKIFVSYKYADKAVQKIKGEWWEISTVRDYVDEIERILGNTNNIYKGERDGTDLSYLSEDQIWEKLKDKIYDSTMTIVLISPGMKTYESEKKQWIPWEIAYSLRITSRQNTAGQSVYSRENAVLAVVLPDQTGSYGYFIENKNCCVRGCVLYNTYNTFQIIRDNMFNRKNKQSYGCPNGSAIFSGEASYIIAVKWGDFIGNSEYYIDRAYELQGKIDDYDITKTV